MISNKFHFHKSKIIRLTMINLCTICSYNSLCRGSARMFILMLMICSIILYSILIYPRSHCFQICPYRTDLTSNRLTFNNGHFLEHFSQFVCPQNFRNLADWVYGWPEDVFEEKIEATSNGSYVAPCLPSGSILFVKTDYLTKFFRLVYPHLINRFVLITAQGDDSAPAEFLSYLQEKDSKIIHWFAQNPDIHSSHSDRFTPIPIGINCYEMANGIQDIYRQYSNNTLPAIFRGKDEPHEYPHLVDITNRVFNGENLDRHILLLNFQRITDPSGLRSHLWKTLCHDQFTSTFIVCKDKPAGFHLSNLSTIHAQNRQYPLWLSPRGNGLDCHRTWEAFYLDAIPVVWNSTLNSLFANLPVITVNNWTELTEPYLRRKLNEIVSKKMTTPNIYRWDQLRFSYWRRMILSKSRHSITATIRKNLCWHGRIVKSNH